MAQQATVIIRNLGEAATHASVAAALAEYGPVKRVDVIRGRGFGFVRFAAAADAKKAVAAGREGLEVDGQVINVALARDKGAKHPSAAPDVPTGGSRPREGADGGDNTCWDFQKGLCKRGAACRFSHAAADGSSPAAPVAAAPTITETAAPTEKKRAVAAAPTAEKTESARAVRGRSTRVFGIPAEASDKAVYKRLRKLEGFEKVKRGDVAGETARPRGSSAVATFTSLQLASRAVTKLHGATFKGATLACRLDAHLDRSLEQRGRLVVRNLHFLAAEGDLQDAFAKHGPLREARVPRVGAKSRGFGFVEFYCEADAKSALKAAASGTFAVRGRTVAVDAATPRSANAHIVVEPAPADGDEASDGEEDGSSSDGEEASEAEEDEEEAEDDDEEARQQNGGRTPAEAAMEEARNAAMDESEEDGPKEKPDDVAEGRTLFVRNVPFGAARGELAKLFARCGIVESVHVVRDRATGLGKGSCFVRYASQDSATNATQEAWALESRPLLVALAVDQTTASKLRDEVGPAKKRKLEHAAVGGDRRHVALASEGLIQPGDAAAVGLPENDLKMRERARQEASTKLRNPLFHVNPQRLSIRNLGPHVDATILRKLVEASGVASTEVGAVHVARDKVEALPGKKAKPGRSKGFAFMEFGSHACALRVLRFANNNPELSTYCLPRGKKASDEVPRPIVAFVVEDHRKVTSRQKTLDEARAKAEAPMDGPSRQERRLKKRLANRAEKKRTRTVEQPAKAKKPARPIDPLLKQQQSDDRAVDQVFDAAERKRDKKKRRKKALPSRKDEGSADVEYAYKAPAGDYLASLKKAVVEGEGRWVE